MSSTPGYPPGEVMPSWPHQREAFKLCMDGRATMLDIPMGLGKTKIVIDVACQRARAMPTVVLVLCPKAVMGVWPLDMKKHVHDDVNATVWLPRKSWSGARRAKELADTLDDHMQHAGVGDLLVVVINYESARGAALGAAPRKPRGFLPRQHWDLVVLDESQKCKKPSGPTHALVKALEPMSSKRIAMSGTPFPQGPVDGWAQFRFLDRRVLGESFVAHRRHYCKLGGPQMNWVQGPINVEQFGRIIAPLTFHCHADAIDLPPLTVVERRFDLQPDERRIYDAMEKDFIAWIDSKEFRAGNVLTRLMRLSMIASGFAPMVDDDTGAEWTKRLGWSRRNAMLEVFDELGPTERSIIFTRFQQETLDVRTACLERGNGMNNCDEISGLCNTVGPKWDGRHQHCVAQIQAGSLGIDLTAGRYTIFYGSTFDFAAYEQAKKRAHRFGQERACTAIHLIANGTVDEVAIDALKFKSTTADTINAVVDWYHERTK
jgi:hypothetical protein